METSVITSGYYELLSTTFPTGRARCWTLCFTSPTQIWWSGDGEYVTNPVVQQPDVYFGIQFFNSTRRGDDGGFTRDVAVIE